MYSKHVIGLADARAAIDAVLAAAESSAGAPIVVVVTDPEGEVVAMARMDGAGHLPRHMALRKAYTSARMGADSGTFGAGMHKAGIDLKDLGDPKITGFAGAVCVRMDGAVIGAVGVSGRSADDDLALATVGAEAISAASRS